MGFVFSSSATVIATSDSVCSISKNGAKNPHRQGESFIFWKVCKRASFTSTLDIEGASKLGKTMYAKKVVSHSIL